ncbi:MAG: PPC domain-containing protein [Aggregatilineales bacterium]
MHRSLTVCTILIIILAACQSESAPLPTLMQPGSIVITETSTVTPDISAADENTIRPTRTRIPERVGVPTPTPDYSNLGTYIRQLDDTDDEDFRGSLSIRMPVHVYTFAGERGDMVTLDMRRFSGEIDPLLRLYNPDSEVMAMDDDSAGNQSARLSNIRLPEEGLYTLQVSGDDANGDYQLRLRRGEQQIPPDTIATPIPTMTLEHITPTPGTDPETARLVANRPAYNTLPRTGDFARYVYYAREGDPVSVSVFPYGNSALRPQIEVYGPEGNLITSAKSSTSTYGGGALILGESMPQTGTYLVIITGEASTNGDFLVSYGEGVTHLDLFRGDAPVNQRVSGDIAQRGVRDTWRVPLLPGDVVTIALSPNSDIFDPVVELINGAGEVLYSDDNGGGDRTALIRFAGITEYDLYFIRVRDARSDSIGAYTLIWRYVEAAPTPTPFPIRTTILSAADTVESDTYNFYTFQGRIGWRLQASVDAAPGSNLDPVLTLLDPDGNVIAQSDDGDDGLNPELITILPDDGSYQLRVNGYLSSGDFELNAAVILSP